MTDEMFADLRKIRNVVNNYFDLKLESKERDSKSVMARLIFFKLVDVYYSKTSKEKPMAKDILAMASLSQNRGIPKLLKEFEIYPNIQEHYNILKHYVTDNPDKFTSSQIKQMILDSRLTLTEVIDATIELNKLQGLGLLQLGAGLQEYCKSKILLKD